MDVDSSDPSGKEEHLYEVLLDYLESSDRGLRPDSEELLSRHPEIASELKEFLDTLFELETLTEPVRSVSRILRESVRSGSAPAPENAPTDAGDESASAEVGGEKAAARGSGSPIAGTDPAGPVRPPTGLPPALGGFPFRVDPAQQGGIGRLGSYRLLEIVGSGGMGIVFRAVDDLLQRPAAVKVLRPERAADSGARQRFLREARLAAALTHEHVVTVYQVGEDAGVAFLAMQWLNGLTLEEALRQTDGPLELPAVLRLGRQAALGLAAAHARGVLHRDMKPANLWVEIPEEAPVGGTVGEAVAAGRVKILDFGLARAATDEDHLTRSGVWVGTPAYMPPEQTTGGPVDARSDLFSLGVILYRMATGRLPFPIMRAAANRKYADKPRRMRDFNPEVPRELDDLVMGLLSTDPARRPASAAELAERLRRLEDRPLTPPARTAGRRRTLAALVALAVLPSLGYLFGGALFRLATNRGEVGDPGRELPTVSSAVAVPVGLGGQAQEAPSPETAAALERSAAEWVLGLGGKVRVRGASGDQVLQGPATLPEGDLRVTIINLCRSAATDDGLTHLQTLTSLESLSLSETRVSDAGLGHLRGLKKLRILALAGTAVTGEGLARVQALPGLEELTLDGTRVDAAGLAQLRPLTRLRQLSLVKLPVGDAGVAHLAALTNLRRLNLADTNVTDAGLEHLRALTNLQQLHLAHNVRVGNAGVRHLLALKDLQYLDLNRTGIDSAGLENLDALQDLRELDVVNTKVGDAGLAHLASVASLRSLVLGGTQVTDAGMAHLTRLKSLRNLDLTLTSVGDAGVRQLAALNDLNGLGLSRTRVGDAGVAALGGLRNLERLDLTGTQASDAGLAWLDASSSLRDLELSGRRVGDATAARIGSLKGLFILRLTNTAVTDKGLASLEALKHLDKLYLDGTRVSDAGLGHILTPPLPPLSMLDLSGSRVSANGAAALKGILPSTRVEWWEPNRRAAESVLAAGGNVHVRAARGGDAPVKSAADLPGDYFRLTRASLAGVRRPPREALVRLAALGDPDFDDLEAVDLSDSGVVDADLECLKTLSCRRLVLDRAHVCGPGLAHLRDMPRLSELGLRCPTLSFLGVRYVGELKHLKRLSLAGSGATDESLKHLYGLTGLSELDLTGTGVTASGVAALREKLPQCTVRLEPPGGR